MTKLELSALIISIIEGGETTSQRIPDPREVILMADTAMGQLAYEDMKREETEVDGRYFAPAKILSVNFDTVRNKKYTNLLSAPLLHKGSAILLISPVQNDSIQFIMATLAENWLTKGLEVGNLRNNVSFFLENKKVYYDNIPPEYTQVLVRQVTTLSSVSDNEEIPLPDHLQLAVIQLVLQFFKVQMEDADIQKQMAIKP